MDAKPRRNKIDPLDGIEDDQVLNKPQIRIELPCGASARVSPGIKPETVAALDEMVRAVIRNIAKEKG